jgi:hypothetical protein
LPNAEVAATFSDVAIDATSLTAHEFAQANLLQSGAEFRRRASLERIEIIPQAP